MSNLFQNYEYVKKSNEELCKIQPLTSFFKVRISHLPKSYFDNFEQSEAHRARMEKQEIYDFNMAKKALTGLYEGTDLNLTFIKTPPFTPVDMFFKVEDTTKKDERNDRPLTYAAAFEIKETKSYEGEPVLFLKLEKLFNMRAAANGHPLFAFFIVDGSEWYIFDLNNVQINLSDICYKPIRVCYFDASAYSQEVPIFYLRPEQALLRGEFENENENILA